MRKWMAVAVVVAVALAVGTAYAAKKTTVTVTKPGPAVSAGKMAKIPYQVSLTCKAWNSGGGTAGPSSKYMFAQGAPVTGTFRLFEIDLSSCEEEGGVQICQPQKDGLYIWVDCPSMANPDEPTTFTLPSGKTYWAAAYALGIPGTERGSFVLINSNYDGYAAFKYPLDTLPAQDLSGFNQVMSWKKIVTPIEKK